MDSSYPHELYLKMVKRSRYEYVKHVGAGVFEITANNQTYFASIIRGWFKKETQNRFNPEITDYSIILQTASSIFPIKCRDTDEMISIMNELTVQGI